MKSFNHKCINVCSSMKVSLLYISIIYELIIILFHLQMMSILCFTYRTVYSPTRSSVSHCVKNSNAYNGFNINKFYIHYYKNVFPHKFYYYAVLSIQMRMRN